ncbi:MAG: hypothetical protein KatS3mg131_2513 [Candidatus Tectimicrobiota bacterium]|nr:MAG: hypothetical protein KatS3mg131_2513 [Candidatus Tectomicrobia bacterium]
MRAELVGLVADKDIEAALDALLGRRYRALGIREIAYQLYRHPQHDPGCLHTGAELLAGLIGAAQDARGLLVFDHAFDGNPHDTAAATEAAVREELKKKGLAGRAEVVVIEPEIETWIFSGSPLLEFPSRGARI